jgi:hypothetical protein
MLNTSRVITQPKRNTQILQVMGVERDVGKFHPVKLLAVRNLLTTASRNWSKSRKA